MIGCILQDRIPSSGSLKVSGKVHPTVCTESAAERLGFNGQWLQWLQRFPVDVLLRPAWAAEWMLLQGSAMSVS